MGNPGSPNAQNKDNKAGSEQKGEELAKNEWKIPVASTNLSLADEFDRR
jgi:hypothetical protein